MHAEPDARQLICVRQCHLTNWPGLFDAGPAIYGLRWWMPCETPTSSHGDLQTERSTG
jgi:hypothetical protein